MQMKPAVPNSNWDHMMEANASVHRGEGKPTLSHIEVAHHMSNGAAHVERIEPGKMAEHMAGCEHCSPMVADADSAAGSAT